MGGAGYTQRDKSLGDRLPGLSLCLLRPLTAGWAGLGWAGSLSSGMRELALG